MGQSGSAHIETLSHNTQQAAPLPVKKVPPPRPASPPPRPAPIKRTPSYVIPENLVMPGGIMPKTKLRPVSQEISKLYPEFAEIFPPKHSDEEWSNSLDVSMETASSGDSEKENSSGLKEKFSENVKVNVDVLEANTLPRTSKSSKNGGQQMDGVSGSEQEQQSVHANAGVKRTNSLDRSPISATNKGHRRNISVTTATTTSLMNEQNTIFEDPREHLYDHWRKDPYTNALPSVMSLPVKSNFDIDVSYNMTYAQLAEYRRKTNLEELERNTGINLNQLSADLNSNRQATNNPFDRHYLRASSRSTSTASSDTGVSKRKKKRAPPPPTASNGNPPDNEPPADYDDDMSPRNLPERLYLRKSSISSMVSTTSSKRMAPPPPDAPKLSSINVPSSKSMQDSVSAMNTDNRLAEDVEYSSNKSKDSTEQNAIAKLDALLNKPDSSDSTNTEQKSNHIESMNSCGNTSTKESVDEVSSSTDNKDESLCAEDRLNSLVQNQDITFADDDSESENTASILPSKMPSPQDMFKEQLAKAYDERQERNKLLLEKKKEKQDTTKLSEQKQEEAVNLLKRMSRDLDKKWLAEHRHKTELEEHMSEGDIDEEGSKSESHRVFSDDWTPQHDLDSDDDIDDRAIVDSPRTKSEGFKSSIIPPKIRDLKTEEKLRKGKYIRRTSDSSTDDKHKYGSIRKFKNNVRKGVQNAFGSISRASGKLLLKAKSQDLLNETEQVQPDPPSNWQLAPEKPVQSSKPGKQTMSSAASDRASKYEVEEFSEEQDSEGSDEGLEEEEEEEELPTAHVKQTGMAYVSGHKQVVLLPDFKTVKLDEQENGVDSVHEEHNWAPKIFRKKKKFTYESTVRRKEKEKIDEIVSEKIREKERQIEFERRRQLEMEKEFHRLRALENQEQLHRLQSANMQQQLQALQQQQAFSGMSMAAPNAGLHGPNSVGITGISHTGFGQHHAMSHVMGQNMPSGPYPQGVGMPFINTSNMHGNLQNMHGNIPNMNGNLPSVNGNLPSVNGNLPNGNGNLGNMGSYDINYLSNVMKMNGIQPPVTTHQWAYLLSSVNVPSAPFEVLHSKSMSVGGGAGPDLSKVFSPFDDAQATYNQKKQLMDYLSPNRDSHGLNYSQSVDPPDTSKFTTLLEDFHPAANSEKLNPPQPELPQSDKQKLKSNPLYYSSDEDDSSSGLSPARTSMVARIKVGDHRDLPSVTDQTEMNGNAQTEALVVNGHVGNSFGASSKVYGPIGFKPVSFNSNSVLSSLGDDDSCSSADR